MGKYVTKRGQIEATTVYSDGELVAGDCTLTLPEITYKTADISAMGTVSMPLIGSLESMETTVNKIGVDKNMIKLTTPGSHNLEYRWVQDVIQSDGTITQEGCKAFMKVMPKVLHPGASLEIGSSSENDLTFEVTRYGLVVSGEEILLVDKFARILKVNGRDYYSSMDRYL